MDMGREIRDFLMTRRAAITPERVGLPPVSANRRVAGLRREEVAMLAGVSVEYYTRLERGHLGGASRNVLDAIARVLLMNDDERTHLYDLARNASPSLPPEPERRASDVSSSVRQVLDSMSVPAIVQNRRLDLLAANRLGRALYSHIWESESGRVPNYARFAFLDPRSEAFYLDLDASRSFIVATLRAAAGRNPLDPELTELIGSLAACSRDFSNRWAKYEVQRHSRGRKRIRHPVIGPLELEFNDFTLADDPEVFIVTYTAAPDSASADGLAILDAWAATQEEPWGLSRNGFRTENGSVSARQPAPDGHEEEMRKEGCTGE